MSNPCGAAYERILAAVRDGAGVTKVVAGPAADGADATVAVHLLGLHPGSMAVYRDHRSVPLRVDALVAIGGGHPQAAELLHDVVRSVVAAPGVELSADPVPMEWWLALGAAPRPAFVVCAHAEVDLTTPLAPLVTEELVVEQQFVTPAHTAPSTTSHTGSTR